jgi:hypothetical protein
MNSTREKHSTFIANPPPPTPSFPTPRKNASKHHAHGIFIKEPTRSSVIKPVDFTSNEDKRPVHQQSTFSEPQAIANHPNPWAPKPSVVQFSIRAGCRMLDIRREQLPQPTAVVNDGRRRQTVTAFKKARKETCCSGWLHGLLPVSRRRICGAGIIR